MDVACMSIGTYTAAKQNIGVRWLVDKVIAVDSILPIVVVDSHHIHIETGAGALEELLVERFVDDE